jgi:hypothetical protein
VQLQQTSDAMHLQSMGRMKGNEITAHRFVLLLSVVFFSFIICPPASQSEKIDTPFFDHQS